MSDADVFDIIRDQRGFLWIATGHGLNRFDGYQFKVYLHDKDNENSPAGNRIRSLALSSDNNLWVASEGGLDRFNPDTEQFTHITLGDQTQPLNKVVIDPTGEQLWVGGEQALYRLDRKSGQVTTFETSKGLADQPRGTVLAMCWDSGANGLWVGTRSDTLSFIAKGASSFSRHIEVSGDIYSLAEDGQRLLVAVREEGLMSLQGPDSQLETVDLGKYSTNLGAINDIAIDHQGNLWLASWANGLFRRKAGQLEFDRFHHLPDKLGSLSHDTLNKVFLEENTPGTIWMGTLGGGLSFFNEETESFALWTSTGKEPDVSLDSAFSVLEDKSGFLWIGTFANGLSRIDRLTGRVDRFTMDDTDASLPSNTVCFLHEDEAARIWVGTRAGLAYIDKVKVTRVPTSKPLELFCLAVTNDKEGSLYSLGTWGDGLIFFRPGTGEFRQLETRLSDGTTVDSAHVYAQLATADSLWVALRTGLLQMTWQGEVLKHFSKQQDDPTSLQENRVISLATAANDGLWVGTRSGLAHLNLADDTFQTWRSIDGLADDTIYRIEKDASSKLWLSTNDGLTRFDPETLRFRNFHQEDGLPISEFNNFASTSGRDGRLYFGGVLGVIAFHPENLNRSHSPPQLAISNIWVNNEHRTYGSLPVVNGVPHLNLKYDEDNIAFEFCALDDLFPKRRFSYLLTGWDRNWIETPNGIHSAQYSRLLPGTYSFLIKGQNREGLANEDPFKLIVHLPPPPWLSLLAKLVYVLAFVGLCVFVWQRHRKKVEKEQEISEQLRHGDKLKNQFLANTSHELRTPVHGIIGLAESMLGEDHDLPLHYQNNLGMMVSSGRRLGALIDDLLDFHKLEEQPETLLALEPVALSALVDDVFSLMAPLASPKKLVLLNQVPSDFPCVLADENRLQQILLNLVGNAIKFTPSGSVEILAEIKSESIIVHVKDTGIGVAEEAQGRIFDVFHQAEGHTQRLYGGTGLGLSICVKLVALHGGTLWLESALGAGSTFSFNLMLSSEQPREAPALSTQRTKIRQRFAGPSESTPISPKSVTVDGFAPHHILVVEDEPVNRQVLNNHLTTAGYMVTLAADGMEALKLFPTEKFDTVLLDMMMPHMSGIQVCKKLRETYSASELPIIFLSARQEEKDKLGGLQAGANDYLTKPLSRDELLMRLRNQLRLLESARDLEQLVQLRTQALGKAHEELAQAAHLAGMGELAAEVMHRLGNSLNSFATSLDQVEELANDHKANALIGRLDEWFNDETVAGPDLQGLPEATRNKLATVLKKLNKRATDRQDKVSLEMGRIQTFIAELREVLIQQQEYARDREGLVRVSLQELVSTALERECARFAESGIEIKQNLIPTDWVSLAPQRFGRVLAYLLDNARQALEQVEKPLVLLSVDEIEGRVVLTLEDNGEGVSPESQNRIFEMGYSTRTGARGFGLHYCANAIREMGGEIIVHSEGTGRGAKVTLSFPIK